MQDKQALSPKKTADSGLSLKVAKICAGISFSLFALIIMVVIFTGDRSTQHTPQKAVELSKPSAIDKQIEQLLAAENIKPARIISSKDISLATRTRRYTFLFSSKAANNDQLLATAADAAMRIQKEMAVQYSSVVLFDSQNREVAYLTVDFAPDKKGANGDTDSGNRFKVTWYNKLPAHETKE